MIHPKIKFKRSAKKDFNTLCAFTNDAKYDDGRNLEWAVFKKYPDFKSEFKKNKYYKIKDKEKLQRFINKEYIIQKEEMDKYLQKHEKDWKLKEDAFFSFTDRLFENHKWPQGKYIAFGTIWGMYPRFLEDKTFQIPFQHRKPGYIAVIIAHELLHFIFYDYFFKRYPKYKKSKHDFFVWHVSEIFNTLIQNSPEWKKVFKIESLGYPEHEKIVKKLSKILYKRKFNINETIVMIISEVKRCF